MNILRNRFLNTASFLSVAPNDEGKKPTTLNEDLGGEDDGAAGDVDAGAEGGQDAGDAGNDESGEGAGGEGDDDGGGADEDDDPDLADLPPEVRAKVKGVIEKKVAKETGWRDRQIDKLHGKRRAAEEDVRTAAAIVDRQPGTTVDDPNRKFTAEEVKTEAARMSAQERYDADANAAFAKGKETYGDKWNNVLAKLPKLGGVEVGDMVDILATDNPHVVLHALADPDTYDRVMVLPPARRRTELIKLSLIDAPKGTQVGSKRPAEQAAPPRTIQGGRRVAAQAVDLRDDKVEDDRWYEARNATRRKKFSSAS